MAHRIYNFNPGPSVLPLPVLEEIQAELIDYKGTGMSVMEISHRSAQFDEIINGAVERIKRLLGLGENFKVLFIQGGASMQFCMIPMNLAPGDAVVDYINTGTWSTKAIKEAKVLGKRANVIASSEDRDFCYIPKNITIDPDAVYAHLTSNNTIKGTQFASFPASGSTPLAADMSSDIFSRAFDPKPFGLIYAGAQKNIGPAGVCLVIVREDMLERTPKELPAMLKYTTYADKNSLYNTPPAFAIYVVNLVMKWLEETMGGLEKMERYNREKGDILYKAIDETDFYRGTADKEDRSFMNVTFRLPSEDLEKRFVAEALNNGLGGLKGHRSVGGCRASIYNACSREAVEALVSFMKEFARKNG